MFSSAKRTHARTRTHAHTRREHKDEFGWEKCYSPYSIFLALVASVLFSVFASFFALGGNDKTCLQTHPSLTSEYHWNLPAVATRIWRVRFADGRSCLNGGRRL